MNKIILSLFILLLLIAPLSAANATSFLLKADDTTSFMNYEYHSLAYEAAVKKQYDESFRIYQKIANKGDDRAEYNIGMMYMKGIGVERKKMNAYKWLRRASKHGNKEAALYFKQMNQRYDKKKPKTPRPDTKQQHKKKVPKPVPVVEEAPIVEPVSVPEPIALTPQKPQQKIVKEEDSSLIYIIIAFILLIIAIAFVFLKKASNSEGVEDNKAPQGEIKYKSQMYDITYAHISEYHNAALKQVNITPYKDNKKKMQAYYMFLAGVIDFFSQLEKFTEIEQRRIFNTHMGKIEGKENLTAITQTVLEGQRDHAMYHFQAAGGISAKEWYEKKSKDALSMLKRLLEEEA